MNYKELNEFSRRDFFIIAEIIESSEKYSRESLGVNKPNS